MVVVIAAAAAAVAYNFMHYVVQLCPLYIVLFVLCGVLGRSWLWSHTQRECFFKNPATNLFPSTSDLSIPDSSPKSKKTTLVVGLFFFQFSKTGGGQFRNLRVL